MVVDNLEKSGINFVSVTEHIETEAAAGKLIFHLFGALSEFERNLIRDRTKAGIAAARACGRKGGRKPLIGSGKIKEIKELMSYPSIKVSTIAKRYGISRATLYKYAKN